MNTGKLWLLVLLVVQGLIAAWLFLGKQTAADTEAELLAFAPTELTAITILDAKANRVELQRQENGWNIGDHPADSAKIEALLSKLAGLQAPWPVATTSDAQTRFEVTEDNFQRRLQLTAGDDLVADLLLGTSPGFRRVHARLHEDDSVYSIDFANHELPMGSDDWLDRSLLSLGAEIVTIEWVDQWRLNKSEDADSEPLWNLADGPADTEAATTLAQRFRDLQVLGTVVTDGELKATFRLSTIDAAAQRSEHEYLLFHNAESDKYHMQRGDRQGRFEVATYIAEQLMVDAASLQPQPQAESTADGESGVDALAEQLVDETLSELPGTGTP